MPLTPFQIQIQNLSKSFHNQILFKELNFNLYLGNRLSVTGVNGSGKSTFLKTIVGKMKPDEGKIIFMRNHQPIHHEFFYQFIAWDAPYLEIYPHFSIKETFFWHFQFFQPILSLNEWLNILQLKNFQNKPLKYLSSGTLQRVKVGLALFSQTPILVLDEPTANMDPQNAELMIHLIYQYTSNRILVIASNLLREIERFDHKLIASYSSFHLNFQLYETVNEL